MPVFTEALGNIIGPIIGFVLGLIPLILIHEFGHLLTGKLMGVWAHEFGVGYPPRIVKLFRWQETDFTLNWIPFGGFTRFEGESTFAEDDGDEETEEKREAKRAAREHSLYSKTPWQRIFVYLGGPVSNLLTAWLIAIIIFMTGIPQLQAMIAGVAPDSPAAEADLREGDLVLRVNEEPIEDSNALHDRIMENVGSPTTLTIQREDEVFTVTVTPRENPPSGQGAVGIQIGNLETDQALTRLPLGASIMQGSRYFAQMATMTVMLPVMVVRQGIPFEQARPVGVVGISQIAEYSVNQSIQRNALYPFLSIVMLLSISLGIFNLLPIPALDGGRILFSLIEAIRGRALTPELEERIHLIALMVMVLLFVAVTILDIVMPIRLE
jgi:regulator of sigma E protease